MKHDPRLHEPKVSYATSLRVAFGMILFGVLFWIGLFEMIDG